DPVPAIHTGRNIRQCGLTADIRQVWWVKSVISRVEGRQRGTNGLEERCDLRDIQLIKSGMIWVMSILRKINEHWGWTGLKAIEILGRNEFGNFLVLDEKQNYWRICPEELTCEVVAENRQAYLQRVNSEDFQEDWKMSNVVELARKHLGRLKAHRAYYLVIPGVLGGRYDTSNIRTAPLEELIGHSGDLALAIKDLPDGAQIELRVID
ncbi:MAG: T6SS immunity protein Tdi1 domain-containing protein, partial [Pelagimonas sp.]|uniref:T6SS immunity protein Tdi1 domain-containing protein n=1 Tax=Pelagimonas sp. TaxID=2073170 RepID=UPI003D6BF400